MMVKLIAVNSKFPHTNISLRYLRNELEALNVPCSLYETTINSDILEQARKIYDEKTQIYCFSCYIWNIEFILKLAQIIKLMAKDAKIFLGGPEVCHEADEFLKNNEFVDAVMIGDAHGTAECILSVINGKGYLNAEYSAGGEIIKARETAKKDISLLSIAYTDEELLELKERILYYEASEGCPFNCAFCLSSLTKGFRYKDINIVKKDIDKFIQSGAKIVKFLDRTFNADKRFAKEIFRYIIEKDTQTVFHFEMSPMLLDGETVEILSKARKGSIQLEIGVQSTDEKTLKGINRADNALNDTVKKLIANDNVHIHMDIIAGLPGEDLKSIIRTYNDIFSFKPHTIQLGFLKALRGLPLRKEAKERGLVFSPYAPYEVICTDALSISDISVLKEAEAATDKYFNSELFRQSLLYLCSNENAFEQMLKFSRKMQEIYKKDSLKKEEAAFAILECGQNDEFLSELIAWDMLNNFDKAALPDFLEKTVRIKTMRSVKEAEFSYDIGEYLRNGAKIKSKTTYIFDRLNKKICKK